MQQGRACPARNNKSIASLGGNRDSASWSPFAPGVPWEGACAGFRFQVCFILSDGSLLDLLIRVWRRILNNLGGVLFNDGVFAPRSWRMFELIGKDINRCRSLLRLLKWVFSDTSVTFDHWYITNFWFLKDQCFLWARMKSVESRRIAPTGVHIVYGLKGWEEKKKSNLAKTFLRIALTD